MNLPEMTHDERLEWLTRLADAGDRESEQLESSVEFTDPILAGALRIINRHGWYYDPVLEPETLLEIVEMARGSDA